MTKKEKAIHRRNLQKIRRAGERKRLKDELKAEKRKYWPKKKISTSKLALGYIFGSCTIVQLYSMTAMWHFGDLSPLITLIGATVGEAITYCAYAAKSTKENTKGGITYDMAMSLDPPDQEE